MKECIQCERRVRHLYGGLFCGERCEKRYYKKQSKSTYTSNRWIKKRLLDHNNICGICLEPILTMKEVTIDHIVPLSKGGADVYENMQLAHQACNEQKGNNYDEDEA